MRILVPLIPHVLNRLIFPLLLLLALPLPACMRADLLVQKATPAPTRGKALPQDRSLENLVAFTRLLGYVRHFHPSDEAETTDWEDFAVRGVLTVEAAQDSDDLVRLLQSLFQPIAPTIRIYHTGEQPPAFGIFPIPQDVTPLYVVAWKHVGFGGVIYQQIGYSSRRIRMPMTQRAIDPNFPNPTQPFHADLGGGISVLVPLALYADGQGILPHLTPVPKPELPLSQDDRAKHLATVVLSWNIFQHFYPYFDVVPVDWLAVLKETLSAARTDDEYTFLKTLRRMVAQLQDGHGAVGAAMTATALTTTQTHPGIGSRTNLC